MGSFSFKRILPVDVYRAICELKENCCAGPDGLEAKYIKLAAHILMYPLADLFNLSLTNCSVSLQHPDSSPVGLQTTFLHNHSTTKIH